MALIPGICTQCGATISVDKAKDCMICPYCGKPFIVEKAINNFHNTYNISNSVVNIYGSKENDFIVRAGILEKYKGPDTSVTIPSNIKGIGDHAFSDCVGLEEVIIPDGIVHIGNWAFNGCLSLRKVTLPNGLKRIGISAFGNCKSLIEISLPDSLSDIGSDAFAYCDKLNTVKMPNNTCNVSQFERKGAFTLCKNLVNVVLPNSSWRVALKGSQYFSEYIKNKQRRQQNLCTSCGGTFWGYSKKVCSKCGKAKDY